MRPNTIHLPVPQQSDRSTQDLLEPRHLDRTHALVRLLPLPAYVLFFLMLFAPTTYMMIKAGIILLALVTVVTGNVVTGQTRLHPSVVIWVLVIVVTGLAFMLVGLLRQAPGALRVGTVYVLWPVLYVVFVSGISNQRILEGMLKVLVLATMAIALYSFSFILYRAGWLPDALYLDLDLGQAIGSQVGFLEYNLYAITSLVFLVPFLIGAVLVWPKHKSWLLSPPTTWIALTLGCASAFLSGRRALWLVIAFAPLLTGAFRWFLPRSMRIATRQRIWLVAAVGCLLILYLASTRALDLRRAYQYIISAFTTGAGASIRREQLRLLLQAWADAPLLGMGHGSSIEHLGHVRDPEMPWSYELTYAALLAQTGTVGFVAYASCVAWLYWHGLRTIRSADHIGQNMLPTLVGTSCFLIANATNPYLGKYDSLWVIFLPLAIVNLHLLRGQSREPIVHGTPSGQVPLAAGQPRTRSERPPEG